MASLAALCGCGGATSTNNEVEPASVADASTTTETAPVKTVKPAAPAKATTPVKSITPVKAMPSDTSAAAGKDDTDADDTDATTPPASEKITAKSTVPAGLVWRGVNLSSAEFASQALPGVYGHQYIYPSMADTEYFKSKGMNIIRVPFLWERMQPALNGALDEAELQHLKDYVASATASGMTVLIDPHNYAHYRGKSIGTPDVSVAAFGNFWGRLGAVFKANPKVVYGLMNEPTGIATETWVSASNEAIRRIRAAGATNTITVPGNGYTGAHSWGSNWYGTPNSVAMAKLNDANNNVLIEAHQYLDSNNSGTSPVCVSETIGAERLVNFTAWLRQTGRRAILGEFGVADNPTCKAALTNMLHYMASNSDVWAGWTYWAAGPWWGSYMYSIQPASGNDKAQMKVLQSYL
jgi:endoglucanase